MIVYLEHYVFDHENKEGVHTAYSEPFDVTEDQLKLMNLIVYTREQTADYSARLNKTTAIGYLITNYDDLKDFLYDCEDEPIEKDDIPKLSTYDVEFIIETAQIHCPCEFDFYDNQDGNIYMYQPQGVVEVKKGFPPL